MTWPNLSAPGELRAARSRLSRQARQSRARISSARWRISRSRATPTARRIRRRICARRSPIDRCSTRRSIAEPLGLFDCCGVSDGCGLRDRHDAGDRAPLGQARPRHRQGAAALRLERARGAAQFLGRQLFRHDPHRRRSAPTRKPASRIRASEVDLIEVHDCFSITELVTMEDLHISPEGRRDHGRARRLLRCRRHGAVPDRRRAQMLRPSDRRLGPAHDLRDVPADARAAPASASARTRRARPHPQSRRLPAPERLLDLDHRSLRRLRHASSAVRSA